MRNGHAGRRIPSKRRSDSCHLVRCMQPIKNVLATFFLAVPVVDSSELTVAVWRYRRILRSHTRNNKCTSQTFFRHQPLGDFRSAQRKERNRWLVAGNARRMAVIMLVMAPPPTQRYGNRKCLSSSPGSTDALLVVKPHRRHICEHYRLKTANIHADFHRGGYVQDIDRINFANEAPLPAPRVHHDIPEQPLSLRLIISLGCEFLTMQPERVTPLDGLDCIVISFVELGARRVWLFA